MSTSNGNHARFKIKTISDLTGFSPTLLRAWERRYDLLDPERQPNGHRFYTQEDLKILEEVKKLMDAGLSIGEISNLGRQTLLEGGPLPGFSKVEAGLTEDGTEEQLDSLRSLAPCSLKVFRSDRFRGEGLGVSLRQISTPDASTIHQLYEIVKRVYELWLYGETATLGLIVDKLRELASPDLVSRLSALGLRNENSDPLVDAALEDARWGALGPLFTCAERVDEGSDEASVRVAVLLARDHAKMLRNAFYDLDAILRAADSQEKAHGVSGFVDKLGQIRWERSQIETRTAFRGAVSSRCLETSTIDRLLYGFLRSATRAGRRNARLGVLQINSELLRWAFEVPGEGQPLPEIPSLAAIAVGEAVGLEPEAAVERGYLGWREQSGRQWGWFHWPLLETDGPVCDCEDLQAGRG